MKECSKCSKISNNYESKNSKVCIDCKKAYRKEYRKKNLRKYWVQTYDDMTLEKYNEMYKSQNGKCLICGTKKKQLNIDHCHSTGKVRGLLCFKCNVGIGFFKDNIKILKKAIKYLNATV